MKPAPPAMTPPPSFTRTGITVGLMDRGGRPAHPSLHHVPSSGTARDLTRLDADAALNRSVSLLPALLICQAVSGLAPFLPELRSAG
jgi:hypothetical protein